jgi:hypothetical protein
MIDATVRAGGNPAPSNIGLSDVKEVEAATSSMRALDYQFGGGACRDAVIAHLSWAQRLLGASGKEKVRLRLFRALGSSCRPGPWSSAARAGCGPEPGSGSSRPYTAPRPGPAGSGTDPPPRRAFSVNRLIARRLESDKSASISRLMGIIRDRRSN